VRRRVLVVDDDRALARTLADILELHGWSARCAHSGEAALRSMVADRPDAILMDIRMPGMDGVEAMRRMKMVNPEVKVILMTAYASTELLEDALRSDAMEVLTKPVFPGALLERLAAALGRSQTVLVVDDDVYYLESLAGLLEGRGISVVRATGLAQALLRLEDAVPRVVLLDLRLKDGVQPSRCVAAIKKASPEVVFILYSGHPELLRETRDQVPREWVQGCLNKPFAPSVLLEMLA